MFIFIFDCRSNSLQDHWQWSAVDTTLPVHPLLDQHICWGPMTIFMRLDFFVWTQMLSLSYGLFSGLRGFSFSLLNSDLIQNLRWAKLSPPFLFGTCLDTQASCHLQMKSCKKTKNTKELLVYRGLEHKCMSLAFLNIWCKTLRCFRNSFGPCTNALEGTYLPTSYFRHWAHTSFDLSSGSCTALAKRKILIHLFLTEEGFVQSHADMA